MLDTNKNVSPDLLTLPGYRDIYDIQRGVNGNNQGFQVETCPMDKE